MPKLEDKFMRVLLMFDVPTKTKQEQRHATKFRNNIIKLGYFMMQFSVYTKICKGYSAAQSSVNTLKKILPPFGNVRVLIITEKQFDNMQILLGSPSFNEQINEDKNLVLFEYDETSGNYRYGYDYGLEQPAIEKTNDSKIKVKKNKKPARRQPSLFEF